MSTRWGGSSRDPARVAPPPCDGLLCLRGSASPPLPSTEGPSAHSSHCSRGLEPAGGRVGSSPEKVLSEQAEAGATRRTPGHLCSWRGQGRWHAEPELQKAPGWGGGEPASGGWGWGGLSPGSLWPPCPKPAGETTEGRWLPSTIERKAGPLGHFLHRKQPTIVSKVGLAPSGGARWLGPPLVGLADVA